VNLQNALLAVAAAAALIGAAIIGVPSTVDRASNPIGTHASAKPRVGGVPIPPDKRPAIR
jgi:hypothetical protein